MNVYYDPEKFGLRIVAEVDLGGGYEYDKFVVWRQGNEFLWAEDSGCSCPTPFGDLGVPDLSRGNRHEVVAAAQEWIAGQPDYRDVSGADIAHLIEQVMTS